jgi:hypothetical protein
MREVKKVQAFIQVFSEASNMCIAFCVLPIYNYRTRILGTT